MRIRIDGQCEAARVIAGYLHAQGYLVTENDPNYTLYLEEGETPVIDGAGSIVIDGVDCPLEARMIYHLAHLTTTRIVLARAGGVQSDQEIRIIFPHAESLAVERGVFRGILDTVGPTVASATTRPGQAPALPEEAVIRSVTREGWSDFSTEVGGRIEKGLDAFATQCGAQLKEGWAQLVGTGLRFASALTTLSEVERETRTYMRTSAEALAALVAVTGDIAANSARLRDAIERRLARPWWRFWKSM